MHLTLPRTRLLGVAVVALTSAAAVLFAAPAAQAVSPDVVIAEVYGGGGNAGAPWRNDFIELYNRGTSTISLTGWSVPCPPPRARWRCAPPLPR